ncbi:MAG: helix-turn-helix domain-containing protein, partial [Myxococcota bacterium]
MSIDDRILDAALKVVQDVGLRAATTRRIADEAGVNEVTLFRRFGSKDQLLTDALRRRQLVLELPLDPVDPASELRTFVRAQAEHLTRVGPMIRSTLNEIDAHPNLCAVAHEGPRKVAADLGKYLERLVVLGLAAPDLDLHAAVTMVMGSVFTEIVARPMMPADRRLAPDEVADRYVPLF